MAININRVYQTVLALANKEQRGYITPQEFNLFANHAQLEIFDLLPETPLTLLLLPLIG